MALSVIRKNASAGVTGLKVTRINKEEASYHGSHHEESELPGRFDIIEETDRDSGKDTSLMLAAGARRVFYIRAEEGYVEAAFNQFLEQYHQGEPIVCESRALRDAVIPGVFIFMLRHSVTATGKAVTSYTEKADIIIESYDLPADYELFANKIIFDSETGFRFR
jgi:hypothetical protein